VIDLVNVDLEMVDLDDVSIWQSKKSIWSGVSNLHQDYNDADG
jgi:hypothetical protein